MKRALLLFVAISAATAYVAWPYRGLSHETVTTTVLFDREIVRILDNRCVMCHAGDGPSFPLETYEQTWLRRRSMRDEAIARHMPPWAAVAGYGEFANDNSLTLREMQFIVSWVEGLGPRNAGRVFTNTAEPGLRAPEIRARYVHAGHWHLGEPDLMRPIPAATIEVGQPSHVRRTVVDLGLTTERHVRAVEFMPGDRRVVRAAFFTVEETGQWIGSWTPWYGYMDVPAGAAYALRRGARVVAEIHYRGTDVPVVDEGKLGLTFADSPPRRAASDLVLTATDAGAAAPSTRRLRAETTVAGDIYAFALRPELTGDITSVEVSARRPDGGTEILLFARDFAGDWPTPYILKEPVLLRRGTVLAVTAYANAAEAAQRVRLTVSAY